jgi:hypothetical protein
VYLTGVHVMGVYLINVHLTGVHVIGVYLMRVSHRAWYVFRLSDFSIWGFWEKSPHTHHRMFKAA